jgi:RecA-family ATPase
MLDEMTDGAVNDTIKRVIPSMLNQGIEPKEVESRCFEAVMALGPRDETAELNRITSTILACYNRMLLGDYDPAIDGIPPAWVPQSLIGQFRRSLQEGRRPIFSRHNGGGYHVKRAREAAHARRSNAVDPKAFTLVSFEPFNIADLPPRAWLYGHHHQRGTVSLTVAPGGSGKTTLCMVEAVAMATGRNLLGEQPTERLKVWLHNGEDQDVELRRRVAAICVHHHIPMEELRGHLFLTSGNEVPLRVAHGYADLRLEDELIEKISAEIGRNEIDCAIFDPLVTLHHVSEQDNAKMDAVVRTFAFIANERECSIELAHHTRKLGHSGGGAYSMDDARGASSIRDAARAARMLNHMTKEAAEKAKIPEHERTSYFRVDRTKGNNAKPEKALWRRFVSVALINGDEVWVVTPWEFTSETPKETEELADTVFPTILLRYEREGLEVSDRVGTNYAPARFAEEMEAEDVELTKEDLKGAMRRLSARGLIGITVGGRPDRPTRVLRTKKQP